MEADESKITQDLQSLNSSFSGIDTQLTTVEQSIAISKGGEKISEKQIERFLFNSSNEMKSAQNELDSLRLSLSNTSGQVATLAIGRAQNQQELITARKSVDGVQNVVTFTTGLQNNQSGEILTLNKLVLDNVKLLKYAFGILTVYP